MPQTLKLGNHIARTYRGLRLGIGAIAILLPFVLFTWSFIKFGSIEPGQSISSYYHSSDSYIRDIFVGSLCATGVFLVLYRGFSRWENCLLDLAGICVIGVALVPITLDQAPKVSLATSSIEQGQQKQDTVREQQPKQQTGIKLSWHGAFSVSFFLSIALVVVFQAKRSLCETVAAPKRGWYERMYKRLGILMVVLPAGAWVYLALLEKNWGIFALETLAIWVFAAYWGVKTAEFWGTAGRPEAMLLVGYRPKDESDSSVPSSAD